MHTINTSSTTWLQLTDVGLLTIQGLDAVAFLQGQLTCDVMLLAVGQSTMAAHCDHKGRVFANFHLYRQEEHSFLLILPHVMSIPLQERLQKYAVFSKVEILNSADQYHCLAINGLPCDLHVNVSQMICIHLQPAKRCLILVEPVQLNALSKQLHASCQPSVLAQWRLLNMQDKLVYIEPATALKFLPQMLNLEAFQAISFNKGCYVGQEIIARVHNLGTLKRHLYYMTSSHHTLKVGDHIEQQNLQGEIIEQLALNKTMHILAVMRPVS